MTNTLQAIISHKQREVEQLKNGKKSLKKALRCSTLAIIAEIKRKSPSKGALAAITDPVLLANTYVSSGANALSILTDDFFFGGCLDDLTQVSNALISHPQPILRKDFIIDEIQIAQASMAGADAILAIVAVLGKRVADFIHFSKALGMEVLVEVHDEAELDIALASGAEMIGINNRNLKTMQVDTQQAFKLLQTIPENIIKVAESGILAPQLAQEYYRAGFDAVLIGEALVKSTNPAEFIGACRHV